MLTMNEESRQIIRNRMAELGVSQDKLAEQVNERRKGREKNRGAVTRHAISRAVNHGGDLPPLLEDVLEELGLVATLQLKKNP
jgi:hypothetical protein